MTAYYAAEMLRDGSARGAVGPVRAVRVQQRNVGCPVDDVIVVCAGPTEPTAALQVKHGIRFTSNNAPFLDAIDQCWTAHMAEGFDAKQDTVGIAFDEGSNIGAVRTHLPELLQWAKTSASASAFFRKANKFKAKARLVRAFRSAARRAAGEAVANDALWRFLRVFQVVVFDFEGDGARDAAALVDAVRDLVPDRDTGRAREVVSILTDAAREFAVAGGEMTIRMLDHRLPADVKSRLPAAVVARADSLAGRLAAHVQGQLDRQRRMRKYLSELFVESASAKDAARSFCDPWRFLAKAVAELRSIDTSFLNNWLRRLGLPELDLTADHVSTAGALDDLAARCDELDRLCDRHLKWLRPLRQEHRASLRDLVAADKADVADEVVHKVGRAAGAVARRIEAVRKTAALLRGGVMLMRAAAGQGKTNFVCDLARGLLAVGVPAVFLVGKDLTNAPLNGLLDHILREVGGTDDISATREALRRVCRVRRRPLVLILDAINEHPNLPAFAPALEQLVEQLLELAFVRIVLTCRSEYFEHRFKNLTTASFASRTHRVDEPHTQMGDRERARMLKVYLREFRIQAQFTHTAKTKLKADPLLLRIFCEAYGGPPPDRWVTLPLQADIYKDRLFEAYIDRKYAELVDRRVERGKPAVGGRSLYRRLLEKIVAEMIADGVVRPVSVDQLDADDHELLDDLLNEDMIVRKDLILGGPPAGAPAAAQAAEEVIGFPFDELRDFLIAQHLTRTVFHKDPDAFAARLRSLVHGADPAAEGVARFVVYAAKRGGHGPMYEVVRAEPWFDDVFLDCVFGVEDELVTDDDVREVKRRFLLSVRDAGIIAYQLLQRWRPEVSARLGIRVLLDLLADLNKAQFNALVAPVFRAKQPHFLDPPHSTVPVDRAFKGLAAAVANDPSGERKSRLRPVVDLLLYLLRLPGPEYDHPARETFLEVAARDRAYAWSVLLPRLAPAANPVYAPWIWDVAGDLVRAYREVPAEALKAGLAAWAAGAPAHGSTAVRVAEFLDAAARDAGAAVPGEVTSAVQVVIRASARRWE